MGGEGGSGEIEFDVHCALVSLHLSRGVPVCGSLLSCEWCEWPVCAVCVRGLWKGSTAAREVGERENESNFSLIFLLPGSLNCRRLWCVAGSGLRQGRLLRKMSQGPGTKNKSKGWRGIQDPSCDLEHNLPVSLCGERVHPVLRQKNLRIQKRRCIEQNLMC